MEIFDLIKFKGFATVEEVVDPTKDGNVLVKGPALKITPHDRNPNNTFFTLPGKLTDFNGFIISNDDKSAHFLDNLPVVFNNAWLDKFDWGWGGERMFLPAEMHSPGEPDPVPIPNNNISDGQ